MVKFYDNPQIDKGEILRYAGCTEPNAATLKLLDQCLELVSPKLSCKVCYLKTEVSEQMKRSDDLMRCLGDCQNVIIFTATIGLEADRLISRYSKISPSKAHIIDSIGSEYIEKLCDSFCKDINAVTERFSPGYGDLPLEYQKTIFDLLGCPLSIGVTLSESLLMIPTKSVTAIVGVKDENN